MRRTQECTELAGWVEGQLVEKILLDTGCSRTMVHKDLVPQERVIEGEAVTIGCTHGDTVLYPLAEVELEVSGKPIVVEAVVSETLPVAVLLGTDVPELSQLLGGEPKKEPCQAMMVVTRARAREQLEEEAAQREQELSSGAQPIPVWMEPDTTSGERPPDETERGDEQDLQWRGFLRTSLCLVVRRST